MRSPHTQGDDGPEALRAAHPYEVPEVIALPLAEGEGNAAYRAWVAAETDGAGKPA